MSQTPPSPRFGSFALAGSLPAFSRAECLPPQEEVALNPPASWQSFLSEELGFPSSVPAEAAQPLSFSSDESALFAPPPLVRASRQPIGIRAYCWVGTLNNPTVDEDAHLRGLKVDEGGLKYLSVGAEIGENGTPHLQMFAQFHSQKTHSQVMRLLTYDPEHKPWIDPKSAFSSFHSVGCGKAGDPDYVPWGAVAYTQKDGDFFTTGTPPLDPKLKGKKEQDRWRAAYDLVKSGTEDWRKHLAENVSGGAQILIQCHRSLDQIRQELLPRPTSLPTGPDCCPNIWITAPSGFGKSHQARLRAPNGVIYDKSLNKWWQGYRGEDYILLDDLDHKHVAQGIGSHLKRWGDKYPFPYECKGGGSNLRPKVIIVTSQHTIKELFGSVNQEMVDAISRRFIQSYINEKHGEITLDPPIQPYPMFVQHSA